jgi:hypothetical protein
MISFSSCSLLPAEKLPRLFDVPAALNNQQLSYLLTFTGSEEHSFIAVLELHEQKITLLAISPTGLSLFSVVRSQEGDTEESGYLSPKGIKPSALLDELLQFYLPLQNIQQNLTLPWRVSAENSTRRVYKGEELRLLIDYQETAQAQITAFAKAEEIQRQYKVELLKVEEI